MKPQSLLNHANSHPILALSAIFLAWKLLIVLIAVATPGPGYDTSTTLLESVGKPIALNSQSPQGIPSQWQKFVRWDAIYFTQMAEHGHVYEQEWAWGIGWTSLLAWTANREYTFALQFLVLSDDSTW
jgi:GPI mannosyltransferase 2